MRDTLASDKISSAALKAIENYHSDVVATIKVEIAQHKVVILGMSGNPFCSKARRVFEHQGVEFHYLEFGSYFKLWKQRLAIKLWSGWPTFPQVFIKGQLIGGYEDLVEWLKTNKV